MQNSQVENALTLLANAYRMAMCAPGPEERKIANAEVRQRLGEVHAAMGDQVGAWRTAFAEELRRSTAANACWIAWRRVQGEKVNAKSEQFRTAFAGEAR
jgi:hypothetical protein